MDSFSRESTRKKKKDLKMEDVLSLRLSHTLVMSINTREIKEEAHDKKTNAGSISSFKCFLEIQHFVDLFS